MKIKPLTPEQQVIRELSERIVKAQGPILILDAIKWGDPIKKDFFKHKFKKLPAIDHNYYQQHNPLSYDPNEKTSEFYSIEHDVRKNLGQFSAVGQIMQRMCREYIDVIEMLKNRGTKIFSKISQQLYGSSEDAFYANAPTLKDLANAICHTLGNIKDKTATKEDERIYTAAQAAKILSARLARYFKDSGTAPKVVVSDSIIADAAAGAEAIRLRKNATFSKRMLKQLEVHEGWVHLGTTLNGKRQPICTFLSKGIPSSTTTQEGLAIIMEIFSFASFPERVLRINNRVKAISMAEEGANFIEIFNYYRETGYHEYESYAAAARIFRGSIPSGKPFTKDLSYTRGFVQIFNYLRLAIDQGFVDHIPLLFVGKTALEDLRLIVDLVEEGLVVKPKYVPPQFKDSAPLCAWSAYSLFLNKLDPDKLALDFKSLLRKE